jgi:hypothetical protein
MSRTKELRDRRSIQRAHDILKAALTDLPVSWPDAPTKAAAHGALDALCWVLRHDHNTLFAENLATLHRNIEQAGYVLSEVQ